MLQATALWDSHSAILSQVQLVGSMFPGSVATLGGEGNIGLDTT